MLSHSGPVLETGRPWRPRQGVELYLQEASKQGHKHRSNTTLTVVSKVGRWSRTTGRGVMGGLGVLFRVEGWGKDSLRKQPLDESLSEVRGSSAQIWGKGIPAEGIARTQVQRWEWAWCFKEGLLTGCPWIDSAALTFDGGKCTFLFTNFWLKYSFSSADEYGQTNYSVLAASVTLSPKEITDPSLSHYSCGRYLQMSFLLITTSKSRSLWELLGPAIQHADEEAHLWL